MTIKPPPDLTAIMRANGVKYVSDLGTGFFVCLHGGCVGTGLTVGEALDVAVAQRATMRPERIAA